MRINQANKVLIFDCDGTVLDTFLLIEKTVFKTFEIMRPEYHLTLDEAHRFFGPLLDDTFKMYAKDQADLQALINCYRKINDELMSSYIKAYDGMEALLKTLKKQGYLLTIVSNKVTESVMMGLKICHLDKYFDLIIGAEKMQAAKPNPDGIYQVLKHYHTNEAIMIGDSIIDIETGQNANIKTIGVTWCKTKRIDFEKHNASYIVDEPQEILRILGE